MSFSSIISAGIQPDQISDESTFTAVVNLLHQQFNGKVLVSSRFTPEDQVLTDLIFKNNLPVRIFTAASEGKYDILTHTVDFYGKTIEVLFHQAVAAAKNNPQPAQFQNENPSTAPLHELLAGKHVLISSLRRDQLKYPEQASPFEWDAESQRYRFYPLFYWTAEEVSAYITAQNIPHIEGTIQVVEVTDEAQTAPARNTFLRRFFSHHLLIPDLKALFQPLTLSPQVSI